MNKVGIRREDKNEWERRVPVIPQHVADMIEHQDLVFCVQPSDIRTFSEEDYLQAGASIVENLSEECPVVFAVKEIPVDFFKPKGVYMFFAHVIKGQAYNMPMLKRIMDLECTLIDYEKVEDEKGRRLVFFGRYAGLAGMIDSLWTLGQRLEWEGIASPFNQVEPAHRYANAQEAKDAIRQVGEQIASQGLSSELVPFVCGFAGYGNVSRGAQEIYDLLPIEEISPADLLNLTADRADRKKMYKVVFKEVDTVEPRDMEEKFDLMDFFGHPEKYKSQFDQYIPHLSMLINAIYWTNASPRLVTKDYLRKTYQKTKNLKLKVIGDISCDIEGGIGATVMATEPDEPVFVYDPLADKAIMGVAGQGPVIMAVDNLPCELPVESSTDFSTVLKGFVPAIVKADYSLPFEECPLPPEIKRAVIVYRGELTPEFKYLEKFLKA
jgi:saccharopine dehydrogenase (NAD+, L-lysine-forming)